MKYTSNEQGEVVLYPVSEPRAREGQRVHTATPEDLIVIEQGGPFKWVPNDPNDPEGPGALTRDLPSLEEVRSRKIAEINAARKVAEVSGVDVPGFGTIPTDKDTRSNLTAVYVKALNDSSYTKNWKVGPTVWQVLDASTIIAIGDAVESHVQAQFDKEETLTTQALSATTVEDLEAIDWGE